MSALRPVKMSALAMILTATMAVPADEPKKVSGEMVREQQPLDLSGEWEGTLRDSESKNRGSWTVKLNDRWLVLERGIDTQRLLLQVTNEGKGKVRIKLSRTVYAGIYRQQSDRVIIALRDSKKGWPVSFRVEADQSLLILHRAKPGSCRYFGIDAR
jgi:hypothetical protein